MFTLIRYVLVVDVVFLRSRDVPTAGLLLLLLLLLLSTKLTFRLHSSLSPLVGIDHWGLLIVDGGRDAVVYSSRRARYQSRLLCIRIG